MVLLQLLLNCFPFPQTFLLLLPPAPLSVVVGSICGSIINLHQVATHTTSSASGTSDTALKYCWPQHYTTDQFSSQWVEPKLSHTTVKVYALQCRAWGVSVLLYSSLDFIKDQLLRWTALNYTAVRASESNQLSWVKLGSYIFMYPLHERHTNH